MHSAKNIFVIFCGDGLCVTCTYITVWHSAASFFLSLSVSLIRIIISISSRQSQVMFAILSKCQCGAVPFLSTIPYIEQIAQMPRVKWEHLFTQIAVEQTINVIIHRASHSLAPMLLTYSINVCSNRRPTGVRDEKKIRENDNLLIKLSRVQYLRLWPVDLSSSGANVFVLMRTSNTIYRKTSAITSNPYFWHRISCEFYYS